ncbi:hypothetical protein KW786_02305 [Candidatus Parcubacteria bacterium]|nr:hypothetical protein [Candidatus Parcubacteria bacterium]
MARDEQWEVELTGWDPGETDQNVELRLNNWGTRGFKLHTVDFPTGNAAFQRPKQDDKRSYWEFKVVSWSAENTNPYVTALLRPLGQNGWALHTIHYASRRLVLQRRTAPQ